jgi:hypothetical protein
MAEKAESSRDPLPLVKKEADLLGLALRVAARAGDPNPELVQHVRGSREALTTLTGSIVHSDDPCYMIAIRGSFSGPRPLPPGPEWDHRRDEIEHWPVKVLVVEISSGQIVDSGGGPQWPELARVSPVVTDHRGSS